MYGDRSRNSFCFPTRFSTYKNNNHQRLGDWLDHEQGERVNFVRGSKNRLKKYVNEVEYKRSKFYWCTDALKKLLVYFNVSRVCLQLTPLWDLLLLEIIVTGRWILGNFSFIDHLTIKSIKDDTVHPKSSCFPLFHHPSFRQPSSK